MADWGTYCGTQSVIYLCQTSFDQLNFKAGGEANFGSWIQGTLIPQAEGFIDTFCNHGFGTPSYGTWLLDGNGKTFIPVPLARRPLIGIGSLSIGGVAQSSGIIKVHNDFVELDGGNFSTGKLNVTMYGSYGYLNGQGTPIVPQDISFVCAQLCANVINDMVRRRILPDAFMAMLKSPEATDVKYRGFFNAPHILPAALQEVLENYRVTYSDVG